jgi:Tfp pilus assembly protein PilP
MCSGWNVTVMRTVGSISLYTLWISCLMLVWMGTQGARFASAEEGASPIQTSVRVQELQERLERLTRPITYRYNPTGKPDPFEPFLKTSFAVPERIVEQEGGGKKYAKPEHCSTPLECMDVGQLTLAGIITKGDGTRIAMAQDAAGVGYVLTPGLRVGYRNGNVAEVLADRVIVEEETEDIRGQTIVQERVLLLHSEEH